MKTFITLLAATTLQASCSNQTDILQECNIVAESPFKTEKFITKKEFREKDNQLFKEENNH